MGGNISYSDKIGPVDYTLSVKNGYGPRRPWRSGTNYRRERRPHRDPKRGYHSEFEQLNTKLKLGIDGPGSSVGNLTLGYTPYWNPQFQTTRGCFRRERLGPGPPGPKTTAISSTSTADYEFALGPGRLKLIGLRHWEHEPIVTTDVTQFISSGAPSIGSRFRPRYPPW